MTSQVNRLKYLLNKHGIADSFGKLSVTTEVSPHGGWGDAVAFVRELTKEQIQKLVAEDKYLSITTLRAVNGGGYSAVRSGGSLIWEDSTTLTNLGD